MTFNSLQPQFDGIRRADSQEPRWAQLKRVGDLMQHISSINRACWQCIMFDIFHLFTLPIHVAS